MDSPRSGGPYPQTHFFILKDLRCKSLSSKELQETYEQLNSSPRVFTLRRLGYLPYGSIQMFSGFTHKYA